MNKKSIALMLAATIAIFATSCNSGAPSTEEGADTTTEITDTAAEETFVPVDSAKAMEAWIEYATPGEMHKMMAGWDGKWNAEVTMWMSDDTPPTTSKGTSTNRMMMNGLYQESDFEGNMMDMPFMGHSIMGYDNAKKKFVSTWIDNMGSGIMKMEGEWDASAKTITSTGNCIDPATGKDCAIREIFTVVDENTQKMEMYGPSPKTGKEMKTMEIVFTRKM